MNRLPEIYYTHDFVGFLLADGELVVRSQSDVEIVDVVGVEEGQSQRVRGSSLLTLSDDECAVPAARSDGRLGRVAEHVADIPRLTTQLAQLHQPRT